MKFRARFTGPGEGKSREIEIVSASSPLEIRLDAVDARFDAQVTAPGSFSILGPSGRHAEASVHREADGTLRVHVGGQRFDFEFLDELTARAMVATGSGGGRKKGDLKASMPGRVLRVLVKKGDEVVAGTPLLVLEAMKMENEVRSTRAGRVRSVDVVPGQAVATGDVLARFEPES
ncbi:MAG: biotin/lipoyl-containing protein [Thermoanaerobaculia bacterium]